MQKAVPFLKRTIKVMVNQDVFFGDCFVIGDLGCSSGTNTLLVASNIIDTVHEVFQVPFMKGSFLKRVCTLFTPLIVFTGFLSRSSLDPSSDDSNSFWELLTILLLEMLEECLEAGFHSFSLNPLVNGCGVFLQSFKDGFLSLSLDLPGPSYFASPEKKNN
ncbi:hypothetical protein L1987_74917 [Smallanthus sonchifolius]|uniref:Uncharacterized protein n=1 Tax=Smallanthus sonchifolius TaxID=185202 RepID=A0ACB9A439_9ASTR|nr:hypothetical protein L1987_74917 [Smallanthus sonchifolius]